MNGTYDVPTQLASLDLLKSEEMEGSTARKKFQQKWISGCYERNVLVGTKVTEKKKLETCMYQLFQVQTIDCLDINIVKYV